LAQDRDAPEIYIRTQNIYPSTTSNVFTLESLTSPNTFVRPSCSNWTLCTNCDVSASVTIVGNLPVGSNSKGFSLHVWDPPPGNDLATFGHSLLKFSVNSIYFYLDLRDNNFHNSGCDGYVLSSPDMAILYDGNSTSIMNDDKLYFSYSADGNYIEVTGKNVSIWGISDNSYEGSRVKVIRNFMNLT
jgi:hypothetical protein